MNKTINTSFVFKQNVNLSCINVFKNVAKSDKH